MAVQSLQTQSVSFLDMMRKASVAARHWTVVTLGFVTRGATKIRGRINIENSRQLHQAGFSVGTRFSVSYECGCVQLIKDASGSNVVSPKSFPKRDGSVAIGERLDVRSTEIYRNFAGEERVLAMYLEDRIVFIHLPTVCRGLDRATRLLSVIESRSLRTAALYAGIGTLDAALHEGFKSAGFDSRIAFANDTWDEAIECMLNDNPAANRATRTFTGGVEEFVASGMRLTGTDLAVIGIPCKGASRLNLATRDSPEMHPIAGHQVLNATMALQQLGWPPLCLLENVLAYSDSASLDMLRRVLEEQGYQTALIGDVDGTGKYRGLNSNEFGDIERRVRMALLAYPKGITLSFESMRKSGPSKLTVGDIRVPECLIDPGEYEKGLHLNRQEKIDKGWINRIVDDSATSTPSLSANCSKQRIEDAKFRHPIDPGKCRLPTPEEHASLKGQDRGIINSLTTTSHAHMALGNGAAKGCWVEFARVLGEALLLSKAALQGYIDEFRNPRIEFGRGHDDLFAVA